MSEKVIPSLPIGIAMDELKELYSAAINKNYPFKKLPSVFLWGPPGVGKSTGIYELAAALEQNTGKKVKVTEIRLLFYSPVDFQGVPYPDAKKEFAVWLRPKMFDFDPSEDVVNLLFLDELSSAHPDVQKAAYEITLDRAVAGFKFPDNVLVVGAGNRECDRSVVYRMPSALANRMMHVEVTGNFDGWVKWALSEGNVHPLVLGYLSFDVSKLNTETIKLDEIAFPTPRTWMMVSDTLNLLDVDSSNVSAQFHKIAGLVGMGTAVEFIAWCKVCDTLPSVEEILNGETLEYPKSPDALSALIAAVSSYVAGREKRDWAQTLSNQEVENLCAYCNSFPMDYTACVYHNLVAVPAFSRKLMKSPSFRDWGKKHRRALLSLGLKAEE